MDETQIVDRVRASGVRAAMMLDLLAVCFSRRESDANESGVMAQRILRRFQPLQGLANASKADLTALAGLEDFEILRSQALMELGRRLELMGKGTVTAIGCKGDVEEALNYLRFEKREHFVAILLDAKNGIMRVATIHIGTLTSSIVGPREVFREAIREGASAIILAHNHPSGNPEPSPEDLQVTGQLVEIGRMLDIPVLDHVIIGDRSSVSLQARGQLGK